ncbi:hypothetical protein AAC387_Pa11g0246 [Persea americana]
MYTQPNPTQPKLPPPIRFLVENQKATEGVKATANSPRSRVSSLCLISLCFDSSSASSSSSSSSSSFKLSRSCTLGCVLGFVGVCS